MSVFSKLSCINQLTKNIVSGWIRNQEKNLQMKNIPNIVYSICILYYHPDEIFAQCDGHSDSTLCPYCSILYEQKQVIIIKASNHSIFGQNRISLNNKYNYQWDIKIIDAPMFHDNINEYNDWTQEIWIGLKSQDWSTFIYTNDGKIFNNKIHGLSKYGQKFGTNDVISVCLNTQHKHISFAFNFVDQGIAYNIQEFDIQWLQFFIRICFPSTHIQIVNFNLQKY